MTSTDRVSYGNPTRLTMADGSVLVVRVTNPDRLRWDLTAPRKGWGKATDVPMLAQTFIAWAAAKREEATDLSWEQFQDACLMIADADDEETTVIRPTTKAPTDELL